MLRISLEWRSFLLFVSPYCRRHHHHASSLAFTTATVHACRFLEATAPGSFGSGTSGPPTGRAAPELDWDHVSTFCDALLSADVDDQSELSVLSAQANEDVPLPVMTTERVPRTVFAWRNTGVGAIWHPVTISIGSAPSSEEIHPDSSVPSAHSVPAVDIARRDALVQQIERVHARVAQETTGTPEDCGWTYKHTLKDVVIHTKVVNGVTISRGTRAVHVRGSHHVINRSLFSPHLYCECPCSAGVQDREKLPCLRTL
jgi:hypothetical protein